MTREDAGTRTSKDLVQWKVETTNNEELLLFAYSEILDATKHQDDKINRLLTTIAFLTAGALALANLNSAKALSTNFDVGGHEVQLAKFLVGFYLVGVVATVIMLVASLSTPLRFPGASDETKTRKGRVSALNVSQFYFHEISKLSISDWRDKWSQDTGRLKLERVSHLVRETHNLALRTEYKYARTNEAVAVMSFALLTFALAAVLILIALAPGGGGRVDPVAMTGGVRMVLGVVLFGYCILTVLGSVRSATQSVVQLKEVRFYRGNTVRACSRVAFVTLTSTFPAALVWFNGTDSAWALFVFPALPLFALLNLYVFLRSHLGPDADVEVRKGLVFWGVVVVGGQILIAIMVLIARSIADAPYLWQLIGSLLAALLLVLATLVRSGLEQRWRVGEFMARQPKVIS